STARPAPDGRRKTGRRGIFVCVTVVRRDARRRWFVVSAAAAVLCALPVAARAYPARARPMDPAVLADRIRASANQPYQGFALSTANMGVPALPRLSDVTSLFDGTIQLRSWYADRRHWRVDVIDTGTEHGVYQTPDAQYIWDYGANLLTKV